MHQPFGNKDQSPPSAEQKSKYLDRGRHSRGDHHRPTGAAGDVGFDRAEREVVADAKVGRVRPPAPGVPIILVARAGYEEVFVSQQAAGLGDEMAADLQTPLSQLFGEQRRLPRITGRGRIRVPAFAIGDRRDERVERRGFLEPGQVHATAHLEADVVRPQLTSTVVLDNPLLEDASLLDNQPQALVADATLVSGIASQVEQNESYVRFRLSNIPQVQEIYPREGCVNIAFRTEFDGDDLALAAALLKKQTLMMPASGYGYGSCDSVMRITFTQPEQQLERGLDALEAVLRR